MTDVSTAPALPIVDKLLAVESSGPDFIGVDDGGCHTCYHRNPDGPEAATFISELYAALDLAYRGGMVDMAGSDFRDRVEAILAKVRGS